MPVKADPPHPEFTRCGALGVTEPLYKSVVPRGSTIWVLIGSEPCKPYETPYPSSGNQASDQSARGPRQRPILVCTTSRQPRDTSALDTVPHEGHCSPEHPATRLPVRTPPNERPAVALTWALRGSP